MTFSQMQVFIWNFIIRPVLMINTPPPLCTKPIAIYYSADRFCVALIFQYEDHQFWNLPPVYCHFEKIKFGIQFCLFLSKQILDILRHSFYWNSYWVLYMSFMLGISTPLSGSCWFYKYFHCMRFSTIQRWPMLVSQKWLYHSIRQWISNVCFKIRNVEHFTSRTIWIF